MIEIFNKSNNIKSASSDYYDLISGVAYKYGRDFNFRNVPQIKVFENDSDFLNFPDCEGSMYQEGLIVGVFDNKEHLDDGIIYFGYNESTKEVMYQYQYPKAPSEPIVA